MSSQPPQTPQFDWTKTQFYAVVALLTMLVGLGIQALLVPPERWHNLFSSPTQGPTQGTVHQSPPSPFSPLPVTGPSISQPVRQQNVCGVWLSATSQKRYNFICRGQESFEIYEVGEQGLNNNGSGKLTEEGNVEAGLLLSPKNRRARLKLKLSADGRTLEGTWQGDDPREFGQLLFHRS
jgi:hypothetical protein